jgi:hypothetical protein
MTESGSVDVKVTPTGSVVELSGSESFATKAFVPELELAPCKALTTGKSVEAVTPAT